MVSLQLFISKNKPLLYIVLSGILYGFLGCFGVQILQEDVPLSSMLYWRFLIAAIWILLSLTLRGRSVKAPLGISAFFPFAICSASYALSSHFFFLASKTAGTGISMVIFFAFPLFVAFHTFFFQRKRVEKIAFIALLLAPMGLFFLIDQGSHEANLWGIFLAVLSAISYSFYIVKSKSMLQSIDPEIFTLYVCLGSSLFFLLLGGGSGIFHGPTTIKAWSYLIALGVFATAIPIQLVLMGLKHISSLKASMASVLEPVTTLIWGVFLLHEPISGLQVIGILLILGASLLTQITHEE